MASKRVLLGDAVLIVFALFGNICDIYCRLGAESWTGRDIFLICAQSVVIIFLLALVAFMAARLLWAADPAPVTPSTEHYFRQRSRISAAESN